MTSILYRWGASSNVSLKSVSLAGGWGVKQAETEVGSFVLLFSFIGAGCGPRASCVLGKLFCKTELAQQFFFLFLVTATPARA